MSEATETLSEYIVPDGMPKSVFENKYSRRKPDGTMQTYAERMREVVLGNFMMDPRWDNNPALIPTNVQLDYKRNLELAVKGVMPTAGRHIQHGDADQPNKIMELHTNCSTAAFSFMLMRLLLRGSGVGRDYSSACCRVNWDNMPDVRLVLDEAHPDYGKTGMYGWVETLRDARHKYDSTSENTRWFVVDDSREGWAKVIEILETAAWQEKHRDKLFIFDFSQVRAEGAPIMGLQGRPASGPLAFMKAVAQVASIKGAGMKPWKQALFIDHYIAASVAWGGARRAARMATKSWRDRDVMEFIDIKRGGFLWSANNSLLVDDEFWTQARAPQPSHARRIFEAAVGAAYWDATGEPGFINVDRLNTNMEGMDQITGDTLINTEVYTDLHHKTKEMINNVVEHIKQVKLPFITNPCFAADTLMVTDRGAFPIKDLVGKEVRVYDGRSWRTIDNFRVTGTNQEMLKITLHDGSHLRVTHGHKMILADGTRCTAADIMPGDKLNYSTVEYDGDLDMPAAYLKGFLLGDGTVGRDRALLWLYEPKYMCMDRLKSSASEIPPGDGRSDAIEEPGFVDSSAGRQKRMRMQGLSIRSYNLLHWCGAYREGLPKEVFRLTRKAKAEFIAGLFDADGTAMVSSNGYGYQLMSRSLALLQDLQSLLKTMGVYAKIGNGTKGGFKDMPGGRYYTQPTWRLVLSQAPSVKLAGMVKFSRLPSFADRQITYTAKPKWNKVVSVEPDGVDKEVYCCTVPETHSVTTVTGIVTGQCSEIVLSSLGGYCVSGNTRILHKHGYSPIESLVGKTVEVFNGQEWSKVTPFQTGENQSLTRVTLSDGSFLDCTDYHRFSIRLRRQGDTWITKTTAELSIGDILPTFRVPFDVEGVAVEDAYTYGAFLGDGSVETRKDSGKYRFTICLYKGKHHLPVTGTRGGEAKNTGITVTVSHLDHEKLLELKNPFLPEWVFHMDRESTLNFIRGWLDTDGSYHKGVGGVSITTAEEQRAEGLHLLMRRVGLSFASLRQVASVGDMTNYGPRNKALWSVYVPASEASILNAHRVRTDYEQDLHYTVKQPRVVSVEPLEGKHKTFCFTEPLRGMGVFGNMLTYQCVIGDINLSEADIKDATDAAALMSHFLVRVNRMQSEYAAEVKRTNRIGVSLTGIHEFAYRMFGLTFRDMIDYYDAQFTVNASDHKAHGFWQTIDQLRIAAEEAAEDISRDFGMVTPHTVTTIKPSGTVSKVMNCTEGAHLPALAHYIRWVQFKIGDPDIDSLRAAGYPFKDISHRYSGHVCIGFPTKQPIVDLMGDKVTTADETTPEENFKWLCLLERYWLGEDKRNNQVSYTLKYDARTTSYTQFMDLILEWQPKIRCCSVMPSSDWQETEKVYGYVPEQPITADEYVTLMAGIKPVEKEAYDDESLSCEGGACPIEFDINR